jgi:hypothetical protein
MTAKQIIDEISSLSPEDQEKVVRFAYQLDAKRQLTGQELASLSEKMVAESDPIKQSALREEMTRGFYGKPDA